MARIYAEQLAAHLWQHMTNEDAAKPLAGPAKVDAAVTTIYAFECTEICRPAVVAVPTRKLNEASTSGYSAKGDMATTAYLLQRQGLLAVEAIEVPFFDDLINIELACLTGLGADFVVACMGRSWSMCGRGRKRQRSSTDLNSSHDPLGQEKPASRFVAPWPKINRRHRHQSAMARPALSIRHTARQVSIFRFIRISPMVRPSSTDRTTSSVSRKAPQAMPGWPCAE
jgi:hypothetical protein